jgi:hypothetical protein
MYKTSLIKSIVLIEKIWIKLRKLYYIFKNVTKLNIILYSFLSI